MLGALGHPAVKTPTLDEIAARGVTYTNAYATTPMCIPSRRELMTGVFSPTHGDRVFNETMSMPDLPLLAQTFRDAGYQAYGVGKLHINPPRDRIGFDDVLVHEMGRMGRDGYGGLTDDYEDFLIENGYPGPETSQLLRDIGAHGPWPLPDLYHYTDWTAREMVRYIRRRDRDRPSFWYMSFDAPHTPLLPIAQFVEMYKDAEIDEAYVGEWAADFEQLPFALRGRPVEHRERAHSPEATREWRRAFYASSTHVDHAIGTVIGELQSQRLYDDTIIGFTSDHGDMMGNHNLFNKMLFYEGSAKIPMIVAPSPRYMDRFDTGGRDNRLAALADVMPTLLELCDIQIPESVEGLSMVGDGRRDYLYGEFYEDEFATRMVHDGRFKLVYYPVGNRSQLFDLAGDPDELHDLAEDPDYGSHRAQLTDLLIANLYGTDLTWLNDGRLVGLPDRAGPP